MFNKFLNNLYKFGKSFLKLKLLHKLFIVFLVLLFLIILKDSERKIKLMSLENLENAESGSQKKNKFSKKVDNDIYDSFYSKHYDSLHLNKKRSIFEVSKIMSLEKKNNYTKILDVGCGTGYNVNSINKNNYNIIGLDKSSAMIKTAKKKYPECKFEEGDILKNNIFDYGTFTHILCLGKTIYEIKNKILFFENCYSLLNDNGYLIVHLVNRDKFKPFVENKGSADPLYDPEQYKKAIDQVIIKIDKNNEFVYTYKRLAPNQSNNRLDNGVTPFFIYNGKFENFENHHVRKNENNLYMPELSKIINLAKSKGFKMHKNFNMDSLGYTNESLYVFKKD